MVFDFSGLDLAVIFTIPLCQTIENPRKVSSMLVTLTSRYDTHFGRLNISLNESKLDGMDLNSNRLEYGLRKN